MRVNQSWKCGEEKKVWRGGEIVDCIEWRNDEELLLCIGEVKV